MLFAEHAQSIGDYGLYNYASTRTVDALHLMALVLVLATLWPVWRRIGFPYAVLIAVNVFPPLLMGGLISMGRVTAVLFPAFLWLGVAIPAAPARGMDCGVRDAAGGLRGRVFHLAAALLGLAPPTDSLRSGIGFASRHSRSRRLGHSSVAASCRQQSCDRASRDVLPPSDERRRVLHAARAAPES